MTAKRELITEDHELRHRTHRRVPPENVQAWAERQGVPPALKPTIEGIPVGPAVAGPYRVPPVYFEYQWHWQALTDPTGVFRQVWLIDGPHIGTSTMVPVDRDLWAIPYAPDAFDGPLERYTYAIERYRNGMWVGRCES